MKCKCPECGREVLELDVCGGCGEQKCTYCVEECGCGDDDSWGLHDDNDEEE